MRLYVSYLLLALVTALLIPISASAQTDAEESVCDGLSGAAWGLCNAYCEVMDCDSESETASSRACLKVLGNFAKHSDEPIPCARVVCPCWDAADVDSLFAACVDVFNLPVTCGEEGTNNSFIRTGIGCSEPRRSSHVLSVFKPETYLPPPPIVGECWIDDVPNLEDEQIPVTEGEAIACRQLLTDRFSDCDIVHEP
jgi:hypothetical protein